MGQTHTVEKGPFLDRVCQWKTHNISITIRLLRIVRDFTFRNGNFSLYKLQILVLDW